ncbi:Stp1/IreP family PP2C-type Ser/Thr phosphatase [Dehalobacter sp. DCM]|uniref:Stp1/IreP family PP2C-type Ser/Thr phosphatase n=1 Tax=Dehalobacter sp. DCM TaxID=2907827 RepID=UPI003081DB22|nr:Stp1/IreP family PP2C-type Ser/Thr phosphatase [Dehalobacter sp. DCM]
MKAAKIHETGCVRKNNEDNYLIMPEESLCAVADGMGGHNAGEIASGIAIAQLRVQAMKLQDVTDHDFQKWMIEAVKQANSEVYEVSLKTEGTQGMGTTLTVLLVRGDKAIIGHVGDSRIYLWRNNTLSLISEDHSMVNELVRLGELTEENARNHPHKNVLSRALGVDSQIDVDCYQLETQPDDVFLLCTDGFSNELGEEEIAAEFSVLRPLEEHLDILKRLVLKRGAPDNFTAVCCVMER